MPYLFQLIDRCVRQFYRIPRLGQFGLSLLLGLGFVLYCGIRAVASDTVVLQYYDQRLSIPRSELQAFADTAELSPDLESFLQQTESDPALVRTWLTTPIAPRLGSVLPQEFALLQINKVVGEPLGREALAPLRQALRQAIADDEAFSVMEVIEEYPQSNVRLVLSSLERVYTDVSLYVTRLQPVLNVAQKLLPELVCECNLTSATQASSPASYPAAESLAYQKAHTALETLFTTELISNDTTPANSATLSKEAVLIADTRSTNADKRIVLTFGPFRPSITLGELAQFAATGELSRGWRFYFNVANVDQDSVRRALSQTINLNASFLDRSLNTVLGEFVLYEVGQLVQTPSGTANIQALRAALVLSTLEDNQLSLLEFLENYPLQQIQLNGLRLARLGIAANQLQARGGFDAVVTDLEGWLLQIQATAAKRVCDCEAIAAAANPLVTAPLPAIPPETVAQFLPADWQPVAPHREDRGIIKVVWLRGTPYEMGYQHGQLLHDEIGSLGERVFTVARLAGKGLALGRLAENRTYPSLIEECRGLTDATQDLGITMDVCMVMAYADVFQEILGYTLPNELFWEGCNQFVATDAATVDGRLYHGSSVDNDQRPVPYVINNPVIFVRQPNNGLPHVFVTYPGAIWPNSGMNVAGITLGLDTAHPDSPDELSLVGRSNVQIMAKILETATSFEQARSVMETQPRVRANLIMITDGKSRQAGVFEFTGKSLGVRPLQENGVLYVTNHFVLPEMYEKQPLPVDPSSQSRFDRFQQLLEPGLPTSYYGQIDPQMVARILRDRVNPYTQQASPLDQFDDDASPGGNGALRQAMYDPERLKLWIAAGQPPVPENPFVCFSMGELLNFPNPARCETPAL
ncbi:MAG: alpha/beta hydrolase [Elainella sp. C42_A2020_010]|nr:alpha/beta hydrolase [Elainella sp. C42_A2020_010]